ncbi:MAG: ABC transporter permease [Deinococcota bacterium]|jgi:peptide/nickel transport system permease protein|nr:ABC transporter permease [Deinococcota bacterium]
MPNYLLFRLLKGALVVFLISVVTFVIMRLMPGDPVYLLLGEGQIQITDAQIAAIRAKWGLDRPYVEQYFIWAGNLLRGDFGQSLVRSGVPVRQMIFEAIPVTALLNLYAISLAILIALPLGIISALKRNSAIDYATSVGSAIGIATPNFWLALMLIVVFALHFRLLPPFGLRSWQGYILPVIVLATEELAVLMRITRGTVLELLPQDFVRTARSKGLSERLVMWRHVVSNALLPIITVIGFRIAFLLSGTIIIETVFALPGIGRLFTDSVLRLDYQVVQSLVVVFAVLVVVVNLLTDLVYALVDPRIRIA